jgi:hypothetical protein
MDTPDNTPAGGSPAPLPGPDDLITMAEASRLSGLAPATLRRYASQGRLHTELLTPRLAVTSRRWLDACLRDRGTRYQGPKPKPLPDDYQAPGPGRPRAPRVRQHATDKED